MHKRIAGILSSCMKWASHTNTLHFIADAKIKSSPSKNCGHIFHTHTRADSSAFVNKIKDSQKKIKF